MCKPLSFAALMLFMMSPLASAQDMTIPRSMLLPGSLNATVGGVGPLEPGNVLGTLTVEQGIELWRAGSVGLVAFVESTVRGDTRQFVWNNTAPALAGVKFVGTGDFGVLQLRLGLAGDVRTQSGLTPTASATYWLGWQHPTAHASFPGTTWASSGITTASEPHNWITSGHAEQGVTTWRTGGLTLAPFIGATATVDAEHRPWNNHGFVDSGVKLVTRVKGASVEVGVAQRLNREWQTRRTAAAPIVFINLWVGWATRLLR
jgi:hypothetical protein